MTRNQEKIFGDEAQNKHAFISPPVLLASDTSKTKRKIFINNFFRSATKPLVSCLVVLVFIWAFLGQIFLPVEYRFGTFVGERIGDSQAKTTRTTLSAEIEKTNAVANENSNVQVYS